MKLINFKLYNSNLLRRVTLVNNFERACNWVLLKCCTPTFVEHSEKNKRHYEALTIAKPLLKEERIKLVEAKERYRANRGYDYRDRIMDRDILEINRLQQIRHELMQRTLDQSESVKRK